MRVRIAFSVGLFGITTESSRRLFEDDCDLMMVWKGKTRFRRTSTILKLTHWKQKTAPKISVSWLCCLTTNLATAWPVPSCVPWRTVQSKSIQSFVQWTRTCSEEFLEVEPRESSRSCLGIRNDTNQLAQLECNQFGCFAGKWFCWKAWGSRAHKQGVVGVSLLLFVVDIITPLTSLNYWLLSSIIKHYQALSTTINHDQQWSTVINNREPIIFLVLLYFNFTNYEFPAIVDHCWSLQKHSLYIINHH